MQVNNSDYLNQCTDIVMSLMRIGADDYQNFFLNQQEIIDTTKRLIKFVFFQDGVKKEESLLNPASFKKLQSFEQKLTRSIKSKFQITPSDGIYVSQR